MSNTNPAKSSTSGSTPLNNGRDMSRRDVLKSSAALAAAAVATSYASGLVIPGTSSFGATSRGMGRIKIGVVGCGGRGTGAAGDALAASGEVELHAMGDVMGDRLASSREELMKIDAERANVPAERCFTGLDAYKKVIASGVDMVILATAPGFRPIHYAAAIEAGKHVFMEKPVAVDPTGVRKVIETSQKAAEKKLSVVTGTQRRHQTSYLQSVGKIKEGGIGSVVAATCYWNQGGLWRIDRTPQMSDVEWQVRNWLYFTWLSGDHIVEQHVHNLDVINWVMGTPVRCTGIGGRQVRTGPEYGHIYDHFAIEYEYANGARVASQCRQQPNCSDRVEETFTGTEGFAKTWPGGGEITGKKPWRFADQDPPAYVQEHKDLQASVMNKGPYLNEGIRIAESTLMAIMGRMSAYTGKTITWEQAMASKLDTMPANLTMDTPLSVPEVAMPGKTAMM